jgi:MFS family permease
MNQLSSAKTIRSVIAASSVGTMIEWYDFYIFGMLSTTISTQFFPKTNPTAALLSTLAIFAAGFIVRPFGALVFGRIGDLIGRKYTFLLTLILMGGATFLIGCVPSYDEIGIAAPIIVLLLRLLQGLALGGEYGGAATYVAEYSPNGKRGFYTSWIQTTATLGLFFALGIILLVKSNMSEAAFNAHWGGWRYPFWISILLVGVSIYIRLKMKESPMFSKLKAEGKTSVNPLKESFRNKANFKMVLLALFGAVMGQGVVWYTGQFYAQNFLETKCFIEFEQSRTIMLWAIALATPFFILWGWLSDKIGRKWIMMAGMVLAIFTYRPIFSTFLNDTKTVAPGAVVLHEGLNVTTAIKEINNKRDSIIITTQHNAKHEGLTFDIVRADTIFANPVKASVGEEGATSDGYVLERMGETKHINKKLSQGLYWKFIGLVFLLILYVTMVYGPIAAFLVELFPTKIRYTSMSLPYHIGNGVFGGLVPFIGLLLTTTYPADPLVGLWYPIGVATLCLAIGTMYLTNKIDRNIKD